MRDLLLDKILECSLVLFEELIVAMGYGGSVSDTGQTIGKLGDGRIDGVIKEDVLGLEMIYLQAKRWKKDSSVSRPKTQFFLKFGRFTSSKRHFYYDFNIFKACEGVCKKY